MPGGRGEERGSGCDRWRTLTATYLRGCRDHAFDGQLQPFADPDVRPPNGASPSRSELDRSRKATFRHHFVDLGSTEADARADLASIEKPNRAKFGFAKCPGSPERNFDVVVCCHGLLTSIGVVGSSSVRRPKRLSRYSDLLCRVDRINPS